MTPSYPGDELMSIAQFKGLIQREAVNIKVETDLGAQARTSPVFWLKLPNDCSEKDIKLTISKETEPDDDFSYYLTFDHMVKYTGKNTSLCNLCTGFNIGFGNWDQLLVFIEALPGKPSYSTVTARHTVEIATPDKMPELPFDETAVSLPEHITAVPTAKQIEQELLKEIYGQDAAIKVVAYQVASFLAKKNRSRVCSIFCWGVPGVGKTRMAEILGRVLKRLCFPGYDTTVIQMNALTEKVSISRLIGADPNYVGWDSKALLETVLDNPRQVFIIDEVEKGHPDIMPIWMSILDEGKLASRKDLRDGSHELDFRECIFIFTSNLILNGGTQIGFRLDDEIEQLDCSEDGVSVKFADKTDPVSFVQEMYQETEKARAAFVQSGVLREIASRFDCFVELKSLNNQAKLRILAKTVLDTAYEYGIRITRIETGIMQELINASTSENALTVRSFRIVVNGYLAPVFMAASGQSGADTGEYRLDGTLEKPRLDPA